MKTRFRLIRRGIRGDRFYCVDTLTGKRTSLHTGDPDAAGQIVLAKNQALRQPALNLNIAKAYLAGSDSGVATRTWQQAMEALIETKHGANQHRWRTAIKDRAFDAIRHQVIIETHGEQLLAALTAGTVSTNVFLRKLHNFCLGMNWLPWPLIPKRQWPAVQFGEKRAITLAEHESIVARERNPERKAFYQLAWHLGASQSDLASLKADDIDWSNRLISITRGKTKVLAQIRLDDAVESILRSLPRSGPLFPLLSLARETDRATEFKRLCQRLGIAGITLHSYRYAWAERAKRCGYPERFAQVALGHNSQAVHRAYAKKAQVLLPPLGEYEQRAAQENIVVLPPPPATEHTALAASEHSRQ
ncbi:MAG TPA: tyrosine-type recombinase/integrase [Candidatus Paceibacterota bacterium]|nr:tyrosine-type recombinase/integrase [Candidatus Paceibacterota bacterium]